MNRFVCLKNQNKNLENKLQAELNNSLIIKNELNNCEILYCSLKEQLRLLKNGNPEVFVDDGTTTCDDDGFKMSKEDIFLIQKHPELKYTIEKLPDGKLSHRTIYGLLRIFSFRMNYSVEKLSIDKCIRKANMYAVKYTNADFNSQFIKLPENTFLTKEEISEILKSAGIEDEELIDLQKCMTKPDGDNNRKYYYIYINDKEVSIATDMWENGLTENENYNSGLISTNKDEAVQRAKDYANYYKLNYIGIFGE